MMNLLPSLEATGFASWLRESIWGYPTVLTLHTLWGRMLPSVGNAF